MMAAPRGSLALLALLAAWLAPVGIATATPEPFSGRVAGLRRQDGFLPVYVDVRRGQVLLELSRLGDEFLYGTGIRSGAGLPEAHLDRGQLHDLSLCRFERAGDRVLLHQLQTAHRTSATDGAERRAVEESFPTAVRAALPIVAEEGGRLLVDATGLVLRDAQIATHLSRAGLGDFRFDRERSALAKEGTAAYPRNTEIEALLTFAAERPGRGAVPVLPDERTLTLRVHHSFLPLPPAGYTPRPLDPRVGFLPLSFKDYGASYGAQLERQLASRWRLRKKDPAAALSEPTQPIVFYLDRAIPEPERGAVRAGILWWNEAFALAGYRNAVVVRDLPEGASLLDVRYSGVTWVHRRDRGWSSGEFQQDPRTGEILHAIVRLDSHRRRTVAQLWQVLQPATEQACQAGEAKEVPSTGAEAEEQRLVMGRIAYLAAHEIGHTLGLSHHFAASATGFGSVMDYYAPNIRLVGGRLDLREAYPQAVGSYDKLAIRWGYGPGDAQALSRLLIEQGPLAPPYPLPGDARWVEYDLGADPAAFLREALAVRRVMLDRFCTAQRRPGEPLSELADRFPLVYLYHRAAMQAAASYVGGQFQLPAPSPAQRAPLSWVPTAQQRAALAALLAALAPEQLDIPDRAAAAILPAMVEGPHGRFLSESGAAFSPLQAARSLAAMTIGALLVPDRAARLTFQGLQGGPGMLTLGEVLAQVVQATWGAAPDRAPRLAELRRVSQRVVVESLINLLERPESSPEVRAAAYGQLSRLRRDLSMKRSADAQVEAHIRLSERDISHALSQHGAQHNHAPLPPLPPVRPI